jgi:hypothetical protein
MAKSNQSNKKDADLFGAFCCNKKPPQKAMAGKVLVILLISSFCR